MIVLLAVSLALLVNAKTECSLENGSVGDHTITSEGKFKKYNRKNPFYILGVTANWCQNCCEYEPVYAEIHEELQARGIPFARADSGKTTWLDDRLTQSDQMPQLFAVVKGKLYRHQGYVNKDAVMAFVNQVENPILTLTSEEEIAAFMEKENDNSVRIIGFMYDEDRDQDSDWYNYEIAALNMANWVNVRLARVEDQDLIKRLKKEGKWILQLNLIMLCRDPGKYKTLDLAYRIEEYRSIWTWILINSLAPVEEIGPFNFQYYKATGLPILMMFVDGQNLETQGYINMFNRVADLHENDIKFGYMDINTLGVAAKKKMLGLVTEILPSVAFNLAENRQLAFDESSPVNFQNLNIFINDFKQDRVGSFVNKSMHPIDPELEASLASIDSITRDRYDELVFTEGNDVLVLYYSTFNNQGSYDIAPSFNKLAHRFSELEYPTMKIYRMDVATEAVPLGISMSNLPIIHFFPAFHKGVPYRKYEGEWDTLTMMFFLHKYSDAPFDLPELPHLSPREADAYWEKKGKATDEEKKKMEKVNERRKFDL